MNQETDIYIQPGDFIEVDRRNRGERAWLSIGSTTFFGTPEQIMDLIERIAALRQGPMVMR